MKRDGPIKRGWKTRGEGEGVKEMERVKNWSSYKPNPFVML
jgi:hypothetical protein